MPISIVSTFPVMYAFGFTLDNLLLMAVTLALGFVDDAIVRQRLAIKPRCRTLAMMADPSEAFVKVAMIRVMLNCRDRIAL